MNLSIVWIDLSHAKLFHFSEEKMERENLEAKHISHHTHHLENDEKDSPQLYDQVADRLKASKRVLILGPGLAKTHFLHRLEKRYPTIAKTVVACETTDHPSDPQIAVFAKKYLQVPVT